VTEILAWLIRSFFMIGQVSPSLTSAVKSIYPRPGEGRRRIREDRENIQRGKREHTERNAIDLILLSGEDTGLPRVRCRENGLLPNEEMKELCLRLINGENGDAERIYLTVWKERTPL